MNRNDYQSGWDTDQFPNNVPEMALAAGIKASRFVIVSDETVFGLYGQTLVDAFVAAGHTPLTFQVKPGENSKCAAAARAAAVSSVWL